MTTYLPKPGFTTAPAFRWWSSSHDPSQISPSGPANLEKVYNEDSRVYEKNGLKAYRNHRMYGRPSGLAAHSRLAENSIASNHKLDFVFPDNHKWRTKDAGTVFANEKVNTAYYRDIRGRIHIIPPSGVLMLNLLISDATAGADQPVESFIVQKLVDKSTGAPIFTLNTSTQGMDREQGFKNCDLVRRESSSLYLGKPGFGHEQEISLLSHAADKASHLSHLSRQSELVPTSDAFSTIPFIAPFQHIGPKSMAKSGLICDSHCAATESMMDRHRYPDPGLYKSPLCSPANCGHSKNEGMPESCGYGMPNNDVPFPHLPINANDPKMTLV